MAEDSQKSNGGDVPTMQKLLDRPFLLLIAGMVIVIIFYTGWGIYDMLSLPTATLP